MGTYVLDDDLVREFVAHQNQAGWGSAVADKFAVELEKQIPLPAPTKIGAVVRTEDSVLGSVWCLALAEPVSWTTPTDPSGHMYRTDQIGRITEVLSEGVDL